MKANDVLTKLKAEIERRMEICAYEGTRPNQIEWETLLSMKKFITSLQQEQPKVQNGKFVFPKYLYARTKDNKTIDMSYAPQDMTAIEYIRNDFVQQEQLENEEKIMNFFDAVGDCGFSQHDILLLNNIWKKVGCQLPKSQVADASKMEQPGVRLEEEIERIIKNEERFMKFQVKEQLIKYVARHFAEWGAIHLNARKEE